MALSLSFPFPSNSEFRIYIDEDEDDEDDIEKKLWFGSKKERKWKRNVINHYLALFFGFLDKALAAVLASSSKEVFIFRIRALFSSSSSSSSSSASSSKGESRISQFVFTQIIFLKN